PKQCLPPTTRPGNRPRHSQPTCPRRSHRLHQSIIARRRRFAAFSRSAFPARIGHKTSPPPEDFDKEKILQHYEKESKLRGTVNSPVFTSAQMRDVENTAFARGISAEALMNQAGAGIAQAVQQFFPRPGYCFVFSGKGNNGGEALVAAARLKRAAWHTDVPLSFPESQCSDLLRKKITEFRDTPAVVAAVSAAKASETPAAAVILDGLLGLGSKPPLRDPILAACREINRLRQEQGAYVFAVDQPTGLDGDSGEADRDC